jgi:hypothetical protein
VIETTPDELNRCQVYRILRLRKAKIMSNRWLERSLSSLEAETRNWPEWKREAVAMEPYLGIPAPDVLGPEAERASLPTPVAPQTSTLRCSDTHVHDAS